MSTKFITKISEYSSDIFIGEQLKVKIYRSHLLP